MDYDHADWRIARPWETLSGFIDRSVWWSSPAPPSRPRYEPGFLGRNYAYPLVSYNHLIQSCASDISMLLAKG
jgi:hypothetical protein